MLHMSVTRAVLNDVRSSVVSFGHSPNNHDMSVTRSVRRFSRPVIEATNGKSLK